MSKKKNWRGVSDRVAKDKAKIYNSREWKELREAKMESVDGLCEECLKQGVVKPARCVHHIIPIETARTFEEMRRLAIDCGINGLRALCFHCHAETHREMGSYQKQTVKERAAARQDRWADNLMNKFLIREDNGEDPPT